MAVAAYPPRRILVATDFSEPAGAAVARAFAAEGAKVLCADIHDGAARETAGSIGPQAQPFAADVTKPEAVAAMVDRCLQHFGRVDVLFANAGIGEAGSAIDLTLEQWNRMLAINLTSVWLCRLTFSSSTLAALVGPVFDKIAGNLVDAFVKRADQVYGTY